MSFSTIDKKKFIAEMEATLPESDQIIKLGAVQLEDLKGGQMDIAHKCRLTLKGLMQADGLEMEDLWYARGQNYGCW